MSTLHMWHQKYHFIYIKIATTSSWPSRHRNFVTETSHPRVVRNPPRPRGTYSQRRVVCQYHLFNLWHHSTSQLQVFDLLLTHNTLPIRLSLICAFMPLLRYKTILSWFHYLVLISNMSQIFSVSRDWTLPSEYAHISNSPLPLSMAASTKVVALIVLLGITFWPHVVKTSTSYLSLPKQNHTRQWFTYLVLLNTILNYTHKLHTHHWVHPNRSVSSV